MKKKKPPFNQEMAIRGANRRLFARSPVVREKLEESRQEFPRYKKDGSLAKKPWVKRQCEVCEEWVGSTKIAIDHIDPVVPPNGFPEHMDMWERISVFMKRLWCEKENLQRICDDCHDKKTKNERDYRSSIKDAELLQGIKDDLYTRDTLVTEHKPILKRIAKKQGPHFEANAKLASDLIDRFFPKKKGKT